MAPAGTGIYSVNFKRSAVRARVIDTAIILGTSRNLMPVTERRFFIYCNMKHVKEIFESFNTHYDYEEKQGHEMDAVSWAFQEGYLLSNNEMRAITDLHFEMLAWMENFMYACNRNNIQWFSPEYEAALSIIKKAKGEL